MSTATDKANELVLTVRASHVQEVMAGRKWLDFRHNAPAVVLGRLEPYRFDPRGLCETDVTRKQIIPYVILRHASRVFCYERGIAGGEERLHSRLSIGIGGHINPGDETVGYRDLFQTIYRAANREQREEVGDARVLDDYWAGIIDDNSDAVGRVHLGFAIVCELGSPLIASKDPSIREGGWLTVEQLRVAAGRLETWSRIVLDNLFSGAHA